MRKRGGSFFSNKVNLIYIGVSLGIITLVIVLFFVLKPKQDIQDTQDTQDTQDVQANRKTTSAKMYRYYNPENTSIMNQDYNYIKEINSNYQETSINNEEIANNNNNNNNKESTSNNSKKKIKIPTSDQCDGKTYSNLNSLLNYNIKDVKKSTTGLTNAHQSFRLTEDSILNEINLMLDSLSDDIILHLELYENNEPFNHSNANPYIVYKDFSPIAKSCAVNGPTEGESEIKFKFLEDVEIDKDKYYAFWLKVSNKKGGTYDGIYIYRDSNNKMPTGGAGNRHGTLLFEILGTTKS